MKIEHIGIAVKDLKKSNAMFRKLFGKDNYKEEKVDSEGVVISFFEVGNTKIELLQAIQQDSAIARFLNKRQEGIHHIALQVDDIDKEMDRLQREGFQLLNETPKEGADNKLIVFLHPKSTNGVLVELCQEKVNP